MLQDSSVAAEFSRLRISAGALLVEVKPLRLHLRLARERRQALATAADAAFAHCLATLRRCAETCRKAGFNPDQPRVPAGSPDGGQWTSSGGNDPRVLSDATPDNEWSPGARYAQAGPRGPRGGGPILMNGQWVTLTPAQAARIAVAEARAEDAIQRVREYDPKWQPTPGAASTVEGKIAQLEAEAREAEARTAYLARNGIGPGLFAVESTPARGAGRNFTSAEREEINRIGDRWGCHTCGISSPGTISGNWVCDHQPPTALNWSGRAQRLYPQCWRCSDDQGLWIIRTRWRR